MAHFWNILDGKPEVQPAGECVSVRRLVSFSESVYSADQLLQM